MNNTRKVLEKYIRDTIESYNQLIGNINEDSCKYPTIEKNGAIYYEVNMTKTEFRKMIGSKNMNEIKWTL